MRQTIPSRLEALIRSRLGLPAMQRIEPEPGPRKPSPSEFARVTYRSRSRPFGDRHDEHLLPASEIKRWLLRYLEFRGQRRVPIRVLAGLVMPSSPCLRPSRRHGSASHRPACEA